MTKDHTTSISALGVLMINPEGKPYLLLYHNIFANIPLDYDLFRQFSIKQYTLKEKSADKFQEWVEV